MNQKRLLIQLNDAIEEGLRRGLIIVRGPFQSGKTTLVKALLKQRQLAIDEYYLNLNQYLIERLNLTIKTEPKYNYQLLSQLKARTSRLFESYLETYLTKFFKEKHLLVIDAIEILFHYPVNLPQLVYSFCRNSNIIILVIPIDASSNFTFPWNFNLAKIIEISD